MGKFISGGKVFFPLNISETVEGSFGNPAFKFSAKSLKKVFAYSPKVKKEMNENFEKCFSQVRSFWNMGFVFDNPADFFRKKAQTFMAWRPWLWSPDSKQESLPKPPFG